MQFSSTTNYQNDSSFCGIPSTLEEPLWYPDSGATHHIMNDSNHFTTKHQYQGNEVVKIGNGAGMPIKHILVLLLMPYPTLMIQLF